MKFQSNEGTADFIHQGNKLVVELLLICSRENKFEVKNRFLKDLEQWIEKTQPFTSLDKMVLFQLRKHIHNCLAKLVLLGDPNNGSLKSSLHLSLPSFNLVDFTMKGL